MTFRDYAEVAPGLFIGSNPDPEDPFELGVRVVIAISDSTPARSVPRHGLLVHWPIKDGPIPPTEILDALARFVAIAVDSIGMVFVHCQAGLNRSALVTARVLMQRGMTAQEAIDRVRAKRSGALGDEYAAWLLAHPMHPETVHS